MMLSCVLTLAAMALCAAACYDAWAQERDREIAARARARNHETAAHAQACNHETAAHAQACSHFTLSIQSITTPPWRTHYSPRWRRGTQLKRPFERTDIRRAIAKWCNKRRRANRPKAQTHNWLSGQKRRRSSAVQY